MSALRAARRPAALLIALLFVLVAAGAAAALRADGVVAPPGASGSPATPEPSVAVTNTVHGRVVGPDGDPVAGASIAIAAIDRPRELEDVAIATDEAGEYRTPALPAGEYELTVGAPGYRPAFVIVTVVDGEAAEAPDPALVPEP
jgi:hypothetical protein